MRVLLKTVAAFALVLSLGLHWALLQTVAWTGMIVTYSRSAPLQVAVAKTFDGENPCALCEIIQEGRSQEKKEKEQRASFASKLDLGIPWQEELLSLCGEEDPVPAGRTHGTSRDDRPPTPPPRIASRNALA